MSSTLGQIPWARKLKLRHLEVFLALHEARGLTAAAEQMHMTQPAMSHWLAEMEDVVGCPLFIRRPFALTQAGEVLRAHAERMLGDVHRTSTELKAVQSGEQGRLAVGTTMPPVLLPRAIARLQDGTPGVHVTVVEAAVPDLLERLVKREIDLVIGALGPAAYRAGFQTEVLMADSLEVVARRGHPLVRRRSPAWSELSDYPWVLPPIGSVMRARLDESFAAQRLAPPVPRVQASSSIRVQLLMAKRDYLSILSTSETKLYAALGVIGQVRISPPIQFPDVGVIYATDRAGPLVQELLNALRAEAESLQR